MSIMGLLIALLIVAVILWGVRTLLAAFAVPEPIHTVIWVICVLLCIILILNALGIMPDLGIRLS